MALEFKLRENATFWEVKPVTAEPPEDGEHPNPLKNESLPTVTDLVKAYPVKSNVFGRSAEVFKAVDAISIDLKKGECIGLVEKSGCGKSTTSKLIAGLEQATLGQVAFNGEEITGMVAQQQPLFALHQCHYVFTPFYSGPF